ncbi:flagellar motor switch protein [Frigidibacter sp. MR17.24]|uniref:flagellar motor switch protein n=1 Tax=Frigidibacter sp. MR17.24 TaxID=3127345 RepID=UPI003012C2CA
MISLAIDAVIVVLLGAALVYGWMISRRVSRLMAVLHELEPMVRAFSAAVDKSEESVKELKTAAETTAAQRVEPRMTAAAPVAPAQVAMPAAARVMAEGDATFASRRGRGTGAGAAAPIAAAATAGLMQLGADKADLVRSFFETSRSRAV